MSLSLNIKQYRVDHHISQEYMAEKLHMCQPNYSRIEKSDAACVKRIVQLAGILGTTPDILQTYHLAPTGQETHEAADWVKALLEEQAQLIQKQESQIHYLKRHIDYLQAAWQQYGRGELPMSVAHV